MTTPVGEDTARRALTRSRSNRMVAGVAGGLGEYFDVDPVWFRVAFVALALGGGAGVLLYLIGWLAVPEAVEDAAGETRHLVHDGTGRGLAIVGAVLIVVGATTILGRVAPWMSWMFWPAVLIAIGAALILRGAQR